MPEPTEAAAHEAPVLTVDRLAKRFTVSKCTIDALKGVSVRVRGGTVTGLIGPDGAGKTTLMRLIVGLLLPDEGGIRALGIDVVIPVGVVVDVPTAEAASFAAVFERNAYFEPRQYDAIQTAEEAIMEGDIKGIICFVNFVVNQSDAVLDKVHGVVRIGAVHDKVHDKQACATQPAHVGHPRRDCRRETEGSPTTRRRISPRARRILSVSVIAKNSMFRKVLKFAKTADTKCFDSVNHCHDRLTTGSRPS